MALRGLPGGWLAFAGQDPRLGLLGAGGGPAWGVGPATPDFRDQEAVLAVSADGARVGFGYELCGKSPALFALAERRLAPGGSAAGLAAARTAAPGLAVEGWNDGTEPSLNGKRLALEPYETARSLAVAPDGRRFVLGTEWSLRLFDRDGKELWRRDVPGIVWAVDVSGDGGLVVAAYGDGTIRWHRLSDGDELLALYPDGDRERWVAWTPQGYYMASPGGEDLIGWQVNHGRDEAPEFYTASRFRDRFYRPDVVALVLDELDVAKALARADRQAGGAKAPEKPVAQNLPPVVHITDPADLAAVDGGDVIVSFEVEAADPVRNVMALVNGRLALRQPRQETAGGRVTGRVLVPVPAGDDTVSLIAENAQGASDPATVRINVRGGTAPPAKKPTLHVIAVGVSNYRNGDLKLAYAAKDAADIATRFLAEKDHLYGDVKVWALRDDEVGRNAILRTFVEVKRGLRPGDVVVVFLSGHGADERGSYFYLPYDVEADGPETITYSGISQLELREALRGFFEAGTKVIALFDTCYSGDAVGAKALPPDIDVVAQELAAAENGIVVITSSTGTERSRESKELQHGIFTSALLEALGGKADANRDGYISLSELRGYLGTRVQALSGNRQHPTVRVPGEKDWEARIALAQR